MTPAAGPNEHDPGATIAQLRSANASLQAERDAALAREAALAEVLAAINASPGDLAPVFDTMLKHAMLLCDAACGGLFTYDGEAFQTVATRAVPPAFAEFRTRHPPSAATSRQTSLLLETRRPVHTLDITATDAYRAGEMSARAVADLGGARTILNVPLLKDETVMGYISVYRTEKRAFDDEQVLLLQNFAAQTVIAMDNARLLDEQRQELKRQTATAEILGVINASPGDLAPVFDMMLKRAMDLSGAACAGLFTFDGEAFRTAAMRDVPPAFAEFRAQHPPSAATSQRTALLLQTRRPVQTLDITETEAYRSGDVYERAVADLGGARTMLNVPLLKDEAVVGYISVYRTEKRVFNDREVALLQNFAAQAVIAMENARLLREQREALERQTATTEVLAAINANPGNLAPVFETVLTKAHALCGADSGSLGLFDGTHFRKVARHGYGGGADDFLSRPYPPVETHAPLFRGETIHVPDVLARTWPTAEAQRFMEQTGLRAWLEVPLYKDGTLLGTLSAWRREPGAFGANEVALLQAFAAQAVIAIENARLLNDIRERQGELDVTFQSMGDGVALFDENHCLAAWNQHFQEMLDVPEEIVAARPGFADYIRYLADRGEYGPDPAATVERLLANAGQSTSFERTRPNGQTIQIRTNPTPAGGFVIIYTDITERKRAEEALRAARDAAENALGELKIAQANLVQAEKMASLGQLTAGIAHEIKNPLNFVNNFAGLSVGLLEELQEAAAPALAALDRDKRTEVGEVIELLTGNLLKIAEHGRRADGIVKGMLAHSRGGSGQRESADINALLDESLNLAFHGARAQDQNFNITLEREFDATIGPIDLTPQDITRVFLNLCANGFYATGKRRREGGDADYRPLLKVTTRELGDAVEIRVRDNGIGVPPEIRDKLFQPFFTTKPTGEGTGLGLSISYDIVTQQHGGTIALDSRVGEYTEFTIRLPRRR